LKDVPQPVHKHQGRNVHNAVPFLQTHPQGRVAVGHRRKGHAVHVVVFERRRVLVVGDVHQFQWDAGQTGGRVPTGQYLKVEGRRSCCSVKEENCRLSEQIKTRNQKQEEEQEQEEQEEQEQEEELQQQQQQHKFVPV
jgi:hypothetical protein